MFGYMLFEIIILFYYSKNWWWKFRINCIYFKDISWEGYNIIFYIVIYLEINFNGMIIL